MISGIGDGGRSPPPPGLERLDRTRTGAIEAATAMMNVAIMVAVGITRRDLGLRRSAAAIGALWGVLLSARTPFIEAGRRWAWRRNGGRDPRLAIERPAR